MITQCAWCKRIKTRSGAWVEMTPGQVKKYQRMQHDMQITHGMCPDCQIREAEKRQAETIQ